MIKVSYVDSKNNFIINNNGNEKNVPIPTLLLSGTSLGNKQKLIRKLDYLKDGVVSEYSVSTESMREIITRIYGTDPPFNSTMSDLTQLKNEIIADNVDSFIPTSWARNASISAALKLDYIFQESGLKPHDYCIPGFNLISSFATIADPLDRSVPTEQWPGENKQLKFDSSFLEYFGFLNGTEWWAKQTNGESGKQAQYDFKLTVQSGNDISGSGAKESNIKTYSRAFEGNPKKNKNINDMLKLTSNIVANISDTNMRGIIQDIISKEMGDVMQVLVYYIWLNVHLETINKVNCVITSGDEVVDLLCQYLDIQSILWSGSTGGLRTIRQYIPKDISPEDKCKKVLEQTYTSLVSNNQAILKILDYALTTGPNTINTELNYYDNNLILEVANLNIKKQYMAMGFDDIVESIKKINQDLETEYTQLNVQNPSAELLNNYSEKVTFLNHNFFVIPFISLRKKKTEDRIPTLLVVDGTCTNITGTKVINPDNLTETLYTRFFNISGLIGLKIRTGKRPRYNGGGSPSGVSEISSKINIREIIDKSGLVFRTGPSNEITYDDANEYEEELILKIYKILCEKFSEPKLIFDYLFIVYNKLAYIFFLIGGVIFDYVELKSLIFSLISGKNQNLYEFVEEFKSISQKTEYSKKRTLKRKHSKKSISVKKYQPDKIYRPSKSQSTFKSSRPFKKLRLFERFRPFRILSNRVAGYHSRKKRNKLKKYKKKSEKKEKDKKKEKDRKKEKTEKKKTEKKKKQKKKKEKEKKKKKKKKK